jgi:glutamine synthetase
LRAELPAPRPTEGDLTTMSEAELKKLGVLRLPTSLSEALAALEQDQALTAWLPPLLLECYQKHKRGEIEALADLSDAEQAKRYTAVY